MGGRSRPPDHSGLGGAERGPAGCLPQAMITRDRVSTVSTEIAVADGVRTLSLIAKEAEHWGGGAERGLAGIVDA